MHEYQISHNLKGIIASLPIIYGKIENSNSKMLVRARTFFKTNKQKDYQKKKNERNNTFNLRENHFLSLSFYLTGVILSLS